VAWTDDGFTADVMRQTLDMSTLDAAAVGSKVNVERAMTAGARLGGHIVQGHVDGTGAVIAVRPGDQWQVVRIALPAELAPLVVDKGSIAVDGVSLTVSAASEAYEPEAWFEVSLIPETLQATTLGERRVGDAVNLETDILARHVERLLAFRSEPRPPLPERGGYATAQRAAEVGAESSFATSDAPAADYAVLRNAAEGGVR
jgi:riboflavin synthase